MELSKFDIEYYPWGAIKGQAIVDFIAKYTHMLEDEFQAQEDQTGETEATKTTWMFYVDGSSTSKSIGGVLPWLL